jgi:hypothetical protein
LKSAFYRAERQGEFMPLEPVTGPWDPRFQNGLALSGLMAHVLETAPAPAGLELTRYHIDILRPAPMATSHISCSVVREGRRLQVLEAELRVDGQLCVRASATRLRVAKTPTSGPSPPLDPPDNLTEARPLRSRSAMRNMMDSWLIQGGPKVLGPGALWVRFNGDIVEGEPITPFVQAAIVSDLGSGISRVVDWRDFTFANVDLSLNLARAPRGPWTYLQAETVTHGCGRALVNSVLSDVEGEFGRAHQTLFIDAKIEASR